MKRKDIAINNFLNGYNCCQSVVLAFKDIIDIDESVLLSITSSFGGGYARMRETCGAISGMCIVLGYLLKNDDPNDYEKKKLVYETVQKLIKEFLNENKYMTCRELLSLDHKYDDPTPSIRNKKFYETRPCVKFIGDAAEILDNYLKSK